MASEVERIGEECRRYSEYMVARMEEAKAHREARSREQAERAAAEMRQLRQELAERVDAQEGLDEASFRSGPALEVESSLLRETEVQRLRNEELHRQQETAVSAYGGLGAPAQRSDVDGSPEHPAPAGDLDPREAIARAAATRRRNSVVAPVDDDGDNEAEYYRRKSWLV